MADGLNTLTVKEAANVNLGQLGSDFVSDTSQHTGKWGLIKCLSACTFASITDNTSGNSTNVAAEAGSEIVGMITEFTLAAGNVQAIRSSF